jgi:ABC-2 type transport system ATP-binding protein
MSDTAITVENVSKTFKLPHEKQSSVKGIFVNLFRGKSTFESQQVLNNINFNIPKGQFFGIVGRNGSGKSTLLKLIAGIYVPDKGRIILDGQLTPFIELGVGFNPELTGRENVFLNGALLGFNRKQMLELYDEIVDFAEIEKFMDQKLKNYSSGMQVRLAFSIAIRAKSDILLIDEVLAVGDAAFQTKCFDYFYELKKKGATVIFVSHDRTSLERFCDRGILIDKGEIVTEGSISKVLRSYTKIILDELAHTSEADSTEGRESISSIYAKIDNVRAVDKDNNKQTRFTYGDPIAVSFDVHTMKDLINPVLGVTIWQKNVDKAIYASNTLMEGINESGTFKKGDILQFQITLPNLLNDGEYFIEPAIANESATFFYDQQPRAARFIINGSDNPYSIISANQSIKINKKHV